MDIIFEQEIPLEKSLILFANYFQFDFGIRPGFHKARDPWTRGPTTESTKTDIKRDTAGKKLWPYL